MSKISKALFGGEESRSETPTGFGSLPGFAQGAFKDLISRSSALSRDLSAFTPAPLNALEQQGISQLSVPFQPLTQDSFQQQLDIFQNPYTQDVINQSVADIQREGQGLYSDVASRASQAGAFGGTRQALLENEASKSILDEIARTSSGLRSNAFNQAASRALENIAREQDLSRRSAYDVLGAGQLTRSIEDARRNPELSALSFLGQQLGLVPTGGGAYSTAEKTKGISQAFPFLFG